MWVASQPFRKVVHKFYERVQGQYCLYLASVAILVFSTSSLAAGVQ